MSFPYWVRLSVGSCLGLNYLDHNHGLTLLTLIEHNWKCRDYIQSAWCWGLRRDIIRTTLTSTLVPQAWGWLIRRVLWEWYVGRDYGFGVTVGVLDVCRDGRRRLTWPALMRGFSVQELTKIVGLKKSNSWDGCEVSPPETFGVINSGPNSVEKLRYYSNICSETWTVIIILSCCVPAFVRLVMSSLYWPTSSSSSGSRPLHPPCLARPSSSSSFVYFLFCLRILHNRA